MGLMKKCWIEFFDKGGDYVKNYLLLDYGLIYVTSLHIDEWILVGVQFFFKPVFHIS